MNTNTIAASAAALIVMAGAATTAQAQSKVSDLDKTFAVTVSQGNMAEVMGSRLALQKSQSKKVRMIAEMLVTQHGKAEVALKQTAALEKITLPPGTDPEHVAMYKKLKSLSGAAFDKAFISGNVTDHYKTIALFNKELNGGTDTQLRSFATKFLPDIETHTQMITAVASNYGIKVSNKSTDNIDHNSATNRLANAGSNLGTVSSLELPADALVDEVVPNAAEEQTTHE